MNNKRKYGLLLSDIEKIISTFQKNNKVNEVILFGSRAKGNFEPGSDIDIALKGESLTLNDINNASLELDDILFPYKLDLIIFERINEKELIEHISRVGKILYSKRDK